jgi:hypothetical protein
MDFFERFLHISPDGGTGTAEVLWLCLVLFAAGFYVLRRARIKITSQSSESPNDRASRNNSILQ